MRRSAALLKRVTSPPSRPSKCEEPSPSGKAGVQPILLHACPTARNRDTAKRLRRAAKGAQGCAAFSVGTGAAHYFDARTVSLTTERACVRVGPATRSAIEAVSVRSVQSYGRAREEVERLGGMGKRHAFCGSIAPQTERPGVTRARDQKKNMPLTAAARHRS
ncbi:hypothetical protein MRX96_013971 [Rhipicephalus microplus]